MKRLIYQLLTTINHGTEEEPILVDTLTGCEIICPDNDLDANLAIAQAEAYNGEVTVENISIPAAGYTAEDAVRALIGG